MNLKPGALFSTFIILEKLPQKGMKFFFKAKHQTTNDLVFLKIFSGFDEIERRHQERIQREARAILKLRHPGIVSLVDMGKLSGCFYFALEWIEGVSLLQWLEKDQPSGIVIERVLCDICKALHTAHLSGVIHRDLKPANILIDSDECVKITDFGLAKILHEDVLTREGEIFGTPSFMSPEQTSLSLDFEKVSTRSDQFSVGVIAYLLVTGKNPFEKGSLMKTLQAVANEEPQPIEKYCPGVSSNLFKAIHISLSKNPQNRFGTMMDMSNFIEEGKVKRFSILKFLLFKKLKSRYRAYVFIFSIFLALVIGFGFSYLPIKKQTLGWIPLVEGFKLSLDQFFRQTEPYRDSFQSVLIPEQVGIGAVEHDEKGIFFIESLQEHFWFYPDFWTAGFSATWKMAVPLGHFYDFSFFFRSQNGLDGYQFIFDGRAETVSLVKGANRIFLGKSLFGKNLLNGMNTFEVSVKGNFFKLFVNERIVLEFEDYSPLLGQNWKRLGLSFKPGKHAFSHFTISRPRAPLQSNVFFTAQKLISKGLLRESLDELNDLSQQFLTGELRYQIGLLKSSILIQLKRFNQAQEELNYLASLDLSQRHRSRILFQLAHCLMKQGNVEKSLNLFTECLRVFDHDQLRSNILALFFNQESRSLLSSNLDSKLLKQRMEVFIERVSFMKNSFNEFQNRGNSFFVSQSDRATSLRKVSELSFLLDLWTQSGFYKGSEYFFYEAVYKFQKGDLNIAKNLLKNLIDDESTSKPIKVKCLYLLGHLSLIQNSNIEAKSFFSNVLLYYPEYWVFGAKSWLWFSECERRLKGIEVFMKLIREFQDDERYSFADEVILSLKVFESLNQQDTDRIYDLCIRNNWWLPRYFLGVLKLIEKRFEKVEDINLELKNSPPFIFLPTISSVNDTGT